MGRTAALAIVLGFWLLAVAPLTTAGSAPAPGLNQAPAGGPARPSPPAFIETYCIACHNDRLLTAGLTLAGQDISRAGADAELWERVLHKVRTGQMPPAGRPRPDPRDVRALTNELVSVLDRAAAAHPNPGRIGLHRMNRNEYTNAVRDLLGLEVDARRWLLPDEADEGFDNIAVSLATSPAHLERYLAAARDISRLAVGDPTLADAPGSVAYRVPKLLEQNERVGEDMPFGSRGGLTVRHHFPLDGDYVIKVRLRRQIYDYILGMGNRQHLDVRLDGRRIRRFAVGGEAQGIPGPLTWNGEIVGETSWELYMHSADEGLEVRTTVNAGTHDVSVSFVDSPWEPEGPAQPLQVDFGRGSDERYDWHAGVDTLSVHGPFNPAGSGDTRSRRTIFTCRPAKATDEPACAKRIVTALARRAYRRPVTDEEVKTLLAFYDASRERRGFEAGIQAALERMLVSFHFLFRVEQDPRGAKPGSPYRVSDFDLASRLSFFLWSSIPDEELLALAGRGRLKDPVVLEQQVRRMLRDARSKALVESFASQWLGVRKVGTWLPDANMFPEFDENLRRSFTQETALFVDSQVRDDRSIVDLLTADYSYLNERLARHYGVPGVTGERFRKVTFSDPRRGGLLGQGGILMVTSYPDRTAPVLRGLWVLDTLLGMPPPPPPPEVPDLAPRDAGGRLASMRERMEVHRQNPACAVCHVRMDPLGFALENFDAIGRWRMASDGVPVDASAVSADGTPLEGVAGLRGFVLGHRDNYVHNLAEKLLTYALGRRVDHHDQPAVRAIVRAAAADGYRWSSIILGVVRSTPFQMRNTAS
ncbi:MAG: DUF1592 domain-containing protein [Acidobacteriota bacterium]